MPQTTRDALATLALRRLLFSALRDGHIDPRGKTDEELHTAFSQFLSTFDVPDSHGLEVGIILEHEETLIAHAGRYAQEGLHSVAIMLYATGVEHLLNKTYVARARQLGRSEEDIARSLRKPMPHKLTGAVTEIGLPPLSETHARLIRSLVDLRNRFVHYKYAPVSESQLAADACARSSVLEEIGDTISYLRQYDEDHVFGPDLRRVYALFGVSEIDGQHEHE
jgi:hypothetical protein